MADLVTQERGVFPAAAAAFGARITFADGSRQQTEWCLSPEDAVDYALEIAAQGTAQLPDLPGVRRLRRARIPQRTSSVESLLGARVNFAANSGGQTPQLPRSRIARALRLSRTQRDTARALPCVVPAQGSQLTAGVENPSPRLRVQPSKEARWASSIDPQKLGTVEVFVQLRFAEQLVIPPGAPLMERDASGDYRLVVVNDGRPSAPDVAINSWVSGLAPNAPSPGNISKTLPPGSVANPYTDMIDWLAGHRAGNKPVAAYGVEMTLGVVSFEHFVTKRLGAREGTRDAPGSATQAVLSSLTGLNTNTRAALGRHLSG